MTVTCLRILWTTFNTCIDSLVTGGRLVRIGIPFRILRVRHTGSETCLTVLEAFQARTLFLVRRVESSNGENRRQNENAGEKHKVNSLHGQISLSQGDEQI